MLNKIKGGGLVGNLIMWTYDACKKEGLKYEYRSDFKKYSRSAYRISIKNGWLDDINKHMKSKYQKFTFEKCMEIALTYNNKKDLRNNHNTVYYIGCRNKWINTMCQHMIIRKKPNNYWTKEMCISEAIMYNTRKEFRKNSYSAYVTMIKNNWLYYVPNQDKYKR
jgi:hypothetical protein